MIKCICDQCGKDILSRVIELSTINYELEEENINHFCSLYCVRDFLTNEIEKSAREWSEFERGLKDSSEEV
jgi:hypothetical protein